MTIKVIASDMDGTFLDDKGSYDKERFSQILDAMTARDMHFVVASGNSMSCLLYTSPSPRDMRRSRMPSSA